MYNGNFHMTITARRRRSNQYMPFQAWKPSQTSATRSVTASRHMNPHVLPMRAIQSKETAYERRYQELTLGQVQSVLLTAPMPAPYKNYRKARRQLPSGKASKRILLYPDCKAAITLIPTAVHFPQSSCCRHCTSKLPTVSRLQPMCKPQVQ